MSPQARFCATFLAFLGAACLLASPFVGEGIFLVLIGAGATALKFCRTKK